jgi:hypothetical protein
MKTFKQILAEANILIGLGGIGSKNEVTGLGKAVQDMLTQDGVAQADKNTIKKFFVKLTGSLGQVSISSKDAKLITKAMKQYIDLFSGSMDIDAARNIATEIKKG